MVGRKNVFPQKDRRNFVMNLVIRFERRCGSFGLVFLIDLNG